MGTNDLIEILRNTVIPILSLIAAILAWISKIRWSTEYTKAKDEVIKSKEAEIKSVEAQVQVLQREIDTLKHFNPKLLLEHFDKMKIGLENYITDLKSELKQKEVDLQEKEDKVAALLKSENESVENLEIAKKDVLTLKVKNDELSVKLENLEQSLEKIQSIGITANEIYNLQVPYEYLSDIRKTKDPSPKQILDWFYANFEDPAEHVPYESKEGGYQYYLGGPEDVTEIIYENFQHLDETVLNEIIEMILPNGVDWIRKGQY